MSSNPQRSRTKTSGEGRTLGKYQGKGPYWDLRHGHYYPVGISISFKRILIKLCSSDLLYSNWLGTFLIVWPRGKVVNPLSFIVSPPLKSWFCTTAAASWSFPQWNRRARRLSKRMEPSLSLGFLTKLRAEFDGSIILQTNQSCSSDKGIIRPAKEAKTKG